MLNGASGRVAYADPNSPAMALASAQLENPSDSGPMRAYKAALSRHSTAVLAGLVATVKPSMATASSMYSIPASAHKVASSSLMAREAPVMSPSPAQNFLKPSPVPGPSTVTLRLPPSSVPANSPTLMEMGSTVDEPVTKTLPPSLVEGSSDVTGASDVAGASEVDEAPSSPPHAARGRVTVRAASSDHCLSFM